MTLSQTTIADLVSPRERGRYQGFFGAVFAFSSIAGPLLGGFITDALSWRWIFYVNIPVGAVALVLIVFGFRRPTHSVAHRVDYLGVMFMSAGTTTLLLVLTLGGVAYAWSSPLIMGLTAASAVLFCLLVRQERRAAEPVFSPHLFCNKVFVIASSVIGLAFLALMGTAVFMPLFFQLVLGLTPSRAGLMMAPIPLGVIASSFLGGRLVSKTGRYKMFPIIGLACATSALFVMMWALSAGAGLLTIESALALFGFGFGFVMPNLTVAIQNAVDSNELGMATATAGFIRSLGGAFGVALAGTIVSAQLLYMRLSSGVEGGTRLLVERGIQQIAQLPIGQRDIVLASYRSAISSIFLVGATVTLVACAITIFLPEIPLRSARPEEVYEPKPLGAPEMASS